jgi:hypothetical protein
MSVAAVIASVVLGVALIVTVVFLVMCKKDKKSSASHPDGASRAMARGGARGRENLVATPAARTPQLSAVDADRHSALRQKMASMNTAALSVESRRRKM